MDEHHKNQQLEHPFQQLLGGRQADLGEVCEPPPEEKQEFEPVNWAFDGEGVGDDRSRAGIRDPWYSRPLDVHRWSEHPELVGLVERLWNNLCADLDREKSGGPKPRQSFQNQLRVLLLDLYVAWLEDPDLCIGISMNARSWETGSRYNALRLSKKITVLVQRLGEAGVIEASRGSYAGPGAAGNRTTRIRAARSLREQFAALKADREAVHQVEGQECIILKDGDGEAARQVEYDDTADTNRMRSELQAYNALLASSFINLPALDVPWIERDDAFGRRVKVHIDRHHQFTRRIFSRGRWDMNGRFYGPWWQSISSRDRAGIFINDVPTVEVDFKGLHLAILAAEQAVPLEGDPYYLPEGTLPGVAAQEQRGMVKHLVLTTLNAKSRKAAFASFRSDYPKGHVGKGMTDQDLDRVLDLLIEGRPWLADSLGADVGIRLMYKDSLIAERVLNHFTRQGIPILCIHDSFIIDWTRGAELKRVMAEASEAVVGRFLPVESKAVGLDEVAGEWPKHVVLDPIAWR